MPFPVDCSAQSKAPLSLQVPPHMYPIYIIIVCILHTIYEVCLSMSCFILLCMYYLYIFLKHAVSLYSHYMLIKPFCKKKNQSQNNIFYSGFTCKKRKWAPVSGHIALLLVDILHCMCWMHIASNTFNNYPVVYRLYIIYLVFTTIKLLMSS